MAGESQLGTAHVDIRGNLDPLDADLSKAKDKVDKGLSKALGDLGPKLQGIGAGLTAGITAPIVGAGAAAVKFAGDLNAGMANVATLIPGNTDRLMELKGAVQDLSVATGKGTKDMADGLYQVISAFGDSADTVKLLEINSRAAKAGLATTTDAINLTSSVTKGYGDTNAEAVQKVADLAFQTANLGQTTFPELAASMGKVVPIAVALGVSQEELFAQFATLTGVTGSTAEVSTQLRASYQALLSPTTEMAGAMSIVADQLEKQGKLAGGDLVDRWRRTRASYQAAIDKMGELRAQMDAVDTSTKAGKATHDELEKAYKESVKSVEAWGKAEQDAAAALGQSIVKAVGVNDALTMLSATAGGNTNTLSKMFGSVEALTAVLALGGPQAEAYTKNLTAMGQAAGSTDTAFREQTEGINKAGFAFQQMQAKAEVTAQKFGDAMAPAISKVIDVASPLVDKVAGLADGFAKLDPNTQMLIVSALGLAAALGPVLMGVGTLLPMLPVLGAVIGVLTGPIGWVILAVGLLAAAWATDFMGIREVTAEAWQEIQPALTELGIAVAVLRQFWDENWDSIRLILEGAWKIMVGFLTVQWAIFSGIINFGLAVLRGDWEGAWRAIEDMFSGIWQGMNLALQGELDIMTGALRIAWALVEADARTGWNNFSNLVNGIMQGIQAVIGDIVGRDDKSGIRGFLKGAWDAVFGTAKTGWDMVAGLIGGIVQGIRTAIDTVVGVDDTTGIRGFLATSWGAIQTTADTLWKAVQKAIGDVVDGIKTGIENVVGTDDSTGLRKTLSGAWTSIKNTADTIWQGIWGVIKTQITSIIRGINSLIDAWNALEFKIPGFDIELPSADVPGVGRVGGGHLGWGGVTIVTPDVSRIKELAEGGIVRQPTLAMVGERGAEAVIPLSRGGALDDLAERIADAVAKRPTYQINATYRHQSERSLRDDVRLMQMLGAMT